MKPNAKSFPKKTQPLEAAEGIWEQEAWKKIPGRICGELPFFFSHIFFSPPPRCFLEFSEPFPGRSEVAPRRAGGVRRRAVGMDEAMAAVNSRILGSSLKPIPQDAGWDGHWEEETGISPGVGLAGQTDRRMDGWMWDGWMSGFGGVASQSSQVGFAPGQSGGIEGKKDLRAVGKLMGWDEFVPAALPILEPFKSGKFPLDALGSRSHAVPSEELGMASGIPSGNGSPWSWNCTGNVPPPVPRGFLGAFPAKGEDWSVRGCSGIGKGAEDPWDLGGWGEIN